MLAATNIAAKIALVGLLAFGAFSGMQQFEGKAFGARLAVYPLAALIVPAIWVMRGRRPPYPHLIDLLLVAPFLIDVLGNTFDLYDTVGWWDDANHFVNWSFLCAAFGVALRRTTLPRPASFGLIVGFGAATAIGWEIAEYFAFIRHSSEVETAYTDTLGDEALGTAGAVVAAICCVVPARR